MSTAIELVDKLPIDSNIREWKPAERAYMQQLGLVDRKNWKGPQPDAPAGVIEAFLMQCRRTALDPGARQIYAAEMGGKWTVLISIDGFRLIADRTGLYRGKKPTQWCGPDGVWRDVWLSPEPPAAAKVAVMRDGFEEPLVAVATYTGYCPRDNKTKELKPSGQWENNPSNQLAKCAEMLALRQAFPNELSGLYGTEEMDQARASTRSAPRQDLHATRTDGEHRVEPPASEPVAPVQTVAAEVRAPSRDWLAEASQARSRSELRPIFEAAGDAGDLGVAVKNPWTGEGEPEHLTLNVYLRRLREPLPEHVEDVVDAEIVEDAPVDDWPTVEVPR